MFLRKKSAWFFSLIQLILISLVLAACGEATATIISTIAPKPTTVPITTAAATNPVTIKWSFWGDDDEIAINKKLIDQFERLNPGIKVSPLFDTWDNYYKHLDKDWTGTNTPDVMFLENISTYASQGILENLDPYLADEKNFKLEDFYPGLLNQSRYKGALYGLPRDNDTKVVFVNLKLLREAGVEVPKAGWTWQDLREAALKLTKKEADGTINQYGYAFEPNDWWRLWILQNGGELFDANTPPDPPTRLLINTPEGVSAIQFFADLINKDKVSPAYDMMDTSGKISDMFINGKVAMAFGNHALVPIFSKNKKLEWDVVPLPMGKKRVNILDGAGYVINQASKNKAASWQFVKFLSSELGQGLFMESGVVVPARQSIREDNIFVRGSKYNWQVFIAETQVGIATPNFRSFNTISQMVNDALLPVWKGEKSAAEVFPTLPAKIDPELAKLKR